MFEIPCTRTTDIGAYLLGGLAQDEAVALRHHIDLCAYCAEALRDLQPLTDQLGATDLRAFAGMTVETPSADLRDRILRRAATEPVRAADDPGAVGRLGANRWKVAAAAVTVFAAGSGVGWTAQLAAAPSVPPTTQRTYWGTGTEAEPQKVRFVSTSATGPKAWASVSSGPAGTYAALYTKGLKPHHTYKWWFEKVDGTRVGLGSFVFPEGQSDWVVCPGGTSVERVELKAIGATDDYGVDVLRAELPTPT